MVIGPGKNVQGEVQPMNVVVGDVVMYPKYGGTEVKIDGKDYIIIPESELYGKVPSSNVSDQ